MTEACAQLLTRGPGVQLQSACAEALGCSDCEGKKDTSSSVTWPRDLNLECFVQSAKVHGPVRSLGADPFLSVLCSSASTTLLYMTAPKGNWDESKKALT